MRLNEIDKKCRSLMTFGNELDFVHLKRSEPQMEWTYSKYLKHKCPELYYKALLTHEQLQDLDILRKKNPSGKWTPEKYYKKLEQLKKEAEKEDNNNE